MNSAEASLREFFVTRHRGGDRHS